jgi:hypothetical protein
MKAEWLILADAAQIVGGKLYLLGGGWDVLTVSTDFPVAQRCAVAASFTIPWNETNQRHNVEIAIASEDGTEIAKISGQLEVGRPAGTPLGTDQRAQFAAELGLEFKEPGSFAIIARVEGQDEARTTFRVLAGPTLQKRAG